MYTGNKWMQYHLQIWDALIAQEFTVLLRIWLEFNLFSLFCLSYQKSPPIFFTKSPTQNLPPKSFKQKLRKSIVTNSHNLFSFWPGNIFLKITFGKYAISVCAATSLIAWGSCAKNRHMEVFFRWQMHPIRLNRGGRKNSQSLEDA